MSGGAGFLPPTVGDFDLYNKYISDFRAFFRLYHQVHHCQSTIATMSIRPYLKWNVIMLLFGYTPYPGCWLIITKITICLVKGSGTKSSFCHWNPAWGVRSKLSADPSALPEGEA